MNDLIDEIDLLQNQIQQVELTILPGNQLIHVNHIPTELAFVGRGTDAVVVRHPNFPHYVFKIFPQPYLNKLENEYIAYQKLGDSRFFSRCYYKGENYLVLRYESGPTLYDCLLQGIIIPKKIIEDVEKARIYARNIGLYPQDIHLKNILLQNEQAKIIDVSEYIHPNGDQRWEHLYQGYHQFYPLIKGKKIPVWVMERVKKTYLNQADGNFSVIEFGKNLLRMLTINPSYPNDDK
ncbi:serine/threonine protein kinase [Thermoflavimicrobium daqui]|uniref:Serine/threonine protein kinase n=1 Tax=Thermoflavimicrobium daqui TaxID=2137476 RepID=A0A364K4E9_9BACL|nr:serine/threonine protein kinase [Thermoflavimicrobium daqui]RAL24254.1 serine/threonine protein kinase [Thermoflavimicrobium daqui]